jgi:hypothetical protein
VGFLCFIVLEVLLVATDAPCDLSFAVADVRVLEESEVAVVGHSGESPSVGGEVAIHRRT